MILRWLLQITLYQLFVNALVCEPMLGTTIRTSDCQIALNLFISKLKLTPPYNDFETIPHVFARHHPQDAKYDLPQGAQFESCGIAVDLTADTTQGAVATWRELLLSLVTLVAQCPGGSAGPSHTLGLGGTSSQGPFLLLVVDPGPGMRNIMGTCMHPRAPQNQNLLWRLAERLCGFQAVSAVWPAPDRSQLPLPPALFPIRVAFGGGGMINYRARGQWMWNGDVWSPSIGNPFTRRMQVRQMWLLITSGVQHGVVWTPPAFSRTVPRVMAAAWARFANGVRIDFRGAWGSSGSNWVPLAGDISNIELGLQSWDWLLIEFGAPTELDERASLTSLRQSRATPPQGLIAFPGGADFSGSTTTTPTTTIPQRPEITVPYQYISIPGNPVPSTITSSTTQTTASVGLLELADYGSNQSAPGGSSMEEEQPAEFRSPGSIPRPDLAAYESLGSDSTPGAGDDDYPSSSNLGLNAGFYLPFPQGLSGPELNAWMDGALSSFHARPSKRPRPNP